MAKTRVYELARELRMESKALLAKLKDSGIVVPSHQSTLTAAQVEKIRVSQTAEKPKVVVRRRRKAAEPAAEAAPASPSDEAAPPAVEPVAAPSEPEATVEAGSGEGAVQPAVQEEVDSVASAAPKAEVAPPPPPAAPPEEEEKATVAEPEAPPQGPVRAVRRDSSGGATIVRRASPEEVRATKSAQDGLRSRRDEGGVPSSSRPEPDASRRAYSSSAPAGGRSDRPWEARKSDNERTNTAAAGAPKRRSLSTRDLLSAASGDEGFDAEAAARTRKRRTVYTPTHSGRRRDLKRRKDLKSTQLTTPRAAYRVVRVDGPEITVAELARQLSAKAPELIKKLMAQGIMVAINQGIDFDTAALIASDYGFECRNVERTEDDLLAHGRERRGDLESRPPIITIMGHVDHGKTSILDAIRESDVASGEAGGVTQHIGAYTVEHNGRRIAFLDTPGHAAFSAMRSRGAQITDIVVLVVAADDGVMPQTIEAISHAKGAEVPILVAVNKIDRPNADLERVYRELSEHGVQSEEWGGDIQFIKTSALKREGISDLLEAIQLQAEMLELKAHRSGPAAGVVVEAHLDKGRGPIATVMVTDGSLETGQVLVAGKVTGRVRAMNDHHGQPVEMAGPSTPVEIIGLSDVPMAGDLCHHIDDEKVARELVEMRDQQATRSRSGASPAASLQDLLGRVQKSEVPEVSLIIKADTQGTCEAIADAVEKLTNDRVRARLIHRAIGGINESDINLAETSGAVVYGFNVRAMRGVSDQAEKRGVVVGYYSVIYELIDAIKALMAGRLPPICTEVWQGRAEVRDAINVPKIGLIAGSSVIDGKITRSSNLRLIRDQIVIYEGKVAALKRFKDDVKEVQHGYECGISFEGYNDIKIGDVIEAYMIEEEAPTLDI